MLRVFFFHSDQSSKLFASEERPMDLRGYKKRALTTRLSWRKDCCEKLIN